MSTALATLNDALVGRTIAAVDARQLGDEVEVVAVTLGDGTRLTFRWHVGSTHDCVGLRVEPCARKGPAEVMVRGA